MTNFILFFNSFLSYILLLVIFAAIALIAVNIGLVMRKKKNLEAVVVNETTSNNQE